jgi:hypothetical protein
MFAQQLEGINMELGASVWKSAEKTWHAACGGNLKGNTKVYLSKTFATRKQAEAAALGMLVRVAKDHLKEERP